MKKILCFCMSALFFAGLNTTANALTSDYSSSSENSEADLIISNNIDSIYEEAKDNFENSASISSFAQDSAEYFILTNQDSEELYIPLYKMDTSDLVESYLEDTEKCTTYVANLSDAVAAPTTETTMSTFSSGSSFLSDVSSTDVKFYSTVYYNYDSSLKYPYLLTSVSGGYTRLDMSVVVSSQSVRLGCSDVHVTQAKTVYPSGSSWSYDSGFKTYIAKTGSIGGLGANYTATLKRGSSTWTFELPNNVF